MLPLFSELWDRTTPTPQTHHLKYRGGSLMSRKETLEDPQEGEEEDYHHAPRDHLRAVEEVVEEAVEEEAEEAAGEHSHCLDTPLFSKPRSS